MTTLADIVNQASVTYGVSPNLIYAVIRAESGGNPNAVSSAGAQGLMQLMPATARELGVSNSFDPTQNVLGGTKFLAQLLKLFNGNVSLAAAGYNAGPGAVQAYGGIPPYPQTQAYVKEILSYIGQGVSSTLQSTSLSAAASPSSTTTKVTTTSSTAAGLGTSGGSTGSTTAYTIATPLGNINIPNPLAGVNWLDVGLAAAGILMIVIGLVVFVYASRKPIVQAAGVAAKGAALAAMI